MMRLARATAEAKRRYRTGALLRDYRLEAGATQVAWAVGVLRLQSQSSLANVEAGRMRLPDEWIRCLPLTDDQRAKLRETREGR